MEYTNDLFQFIEKTRNDINKYLTEVDYKNNIFCYSDIVKYIYTQINKQDTQEFEKIIYNYIIEDCFLRVYNTDCYDEFLNLLNVKEDSEHDENPTELETIEVGN